MQQWINVQQAAELLKTSERNIRKQAQNGKIKYHYVSGHGRGGKILQILLSSLPKEAQTCYYNIEAEKSGLDKISGKQRTEVSNKIWIVELYLRRDKGMTVDDFISWYNAEYDDFITASQLFRWQKKLKESGPAALIDKRGGHNKGQTSIPQEAWDYFYALYMTQQKRGVPLCYDYTKKKYQNIPSLHTFYRKVKEINPYAIKYYREGEKALRDSLPYMERSRLDISSNDIWFSDHHRVDVFTVSESGNRICRLWLTTFFDARSNKVISYICREADPNATVIKQCFRQGIEHFGIPKEVYFDNGKDYRSKSFSEEYPLSLINQIGVGMIHATPYHGQAKTVERFFGTLEERFGKMFPTYTGRDAKQRPEQMRISNEKILTYGVSTQDFKDCLDNYIEEYNNTPSRGADMDKKSPNEVYAENLTIKRELHDKRALTILCGTFVKRTVHRNGITLMGRFYEFENQIHYYKKTVVICYTPENIDEAYVFDEDMRSVGVAIAKIRTPFRKTTEADYRAAQKEKRKVRKLVREAKPIMELDTMQLIAKKQLEEKTQKEGGKNENLESVKRPGIEQLPPTFSTEPFKDTPSNEMEDSGGLSIQDILMEKYNQERKRKIEGG